MAVRLGILSDTHVGGECLGIPLWVSEAFAGVDMIIHAGDLEDADILAELTAIAPCYAVRGNMDSSVTNLPLFRTLEVEGRLVLVAHRYEEAVRHMNAEVLLLVHGHTHIPEFRDEGAVFVLNPGSPTRPRGGNRRSVALVEISGNSVKATFKYQPEHADT